MNALSANQRSLNWRRLSVILLLLLLFIVGVPFLAFISFSALRIPAMLLTRPYFWEITNSIPEPEAMSGRYVIARESQSWAPNAVIVLAVDHSASVRDIPAYDGFGSAKSCVWNGAGRWITAQSGELAIEITQSLPSSKKDCGNGWVDYGFDLLNRKPPHRLWLVVGDPDEGFGLIFNRQNS